MSPTYIVAKQVVVAVLLVAAFGLFAVRVRRLLAIMRSVKGSILVPVPQLAKRQLAERAKILFSDILGQANVRRQPGIGLAHMAIFFGFLLIQPHSLELMLRGVFPSFSLHALVPGLYTAFMAVADVAGFLCLIGFGYVLYRRLVVKPSYLPEGRDAFLIILFTTVIVITFHSINALETVSPYAANGILLTGVPVSSALASLLGLAHWPEPVRSGVFEAVYWVHILVILSFLVYIPGSKHLHLLAAVPNVILKPLRVEKAIGKTDVEDENAETFGLGFINEITWKQVLDLYSCTECGRCEEQCPAARTGKSLSPRQFVHDLKAELFDNSAAVCKGEGDIPAIIREGGHVLAEQVWDCTTCRACEEVCPVNIQHLDFMFELRKHQVLMEAAFPPELGDAFTNIENQSNPWGLPSAKRGDWATEAGGEAGVPHISELPDAEIVYFAGSALSLEDRGKQVSRALMRVLAHANVKVACLGADEQDSGDDARRAGNEYLAQGIIRANIEMLDGYGVRTILTACPHTYNILKNEYPQFGGNYTVLHHSEYLETLLASGRLQLPARQGKSVACTYHDSCYLGRWNGIFDAPRSVLRHIAGDAAVAEMRDSHEKNLCCGGGGARMFMEETGERINHARTRQAAATGAQVVVSACPYCLTMFSDGIKELGLGMRALDLAEVVLERISGEAE